MHPIAYAALGRHEHRVEFEPTIELAAARLEVRSAAPRWDGPAFFSVDSAGTRDFDDATAFELEHERLRIHVAIAHPPAFFGREDPLYGCAIERGGSVYLPDLVVPMLPTSFAHERAPLSADHDRPALVVSFDACENGDIANVSLRTATVRVEQNLSYDEADDRLRSLDDVETATVRWATASRTWRAANGAIHIEIPRVRVASANDEPLQLAIESRTSPARRVLAECMVRCNEAVGRFCAEHGIAAPFRARERFAGDVPDAAQSPLDVMAACDDTGPHVAASMRLLQTIPPASVSLSPVPHHGMGVRAYVQVTSPLRRAADLLAHHQLADHLAGRTPLLVEELAGPVLACDLAFRRTERIMRDVHRSWLVAWHAQQLGSSFRAWPLAPIEPGEHGEVVLEPTWLKGALRLRHGALPGTPVAVVVRGADVARQRLSLSEP